MIRRLTLTLLALAALGIVGTTAASAAPENAPDAAPTEQWGYPYAPLSYGWGRYAVPSYSYYTPSVGYYAPSAGYYSPSVTRTTTRSYSDGSWSRTRTRVSWR